MNLLPSLEELIPIVDKNNIFYECGFNVKFNNFPFQKKLQILCDIVRQSVYPNGLPNPDNDIIELNGNCYTASFCFFNYVRKLNIGVNARCALARKRLFDMDDVTTIHVVVLIDSEEGHTYQVDPTPFAGYKYGSVDDITYKGIYDEYVVIDDTINNYLYKFRKIIYDDYTNRFNKKRINEYLNLCHIIDECPILKGYVVLALKIIIKYLDDESKKNKIRQWINVIKPYSKNNVDKIRDLSYKLKKQTNTWLEELRDLQQSNYDIKRKSELAIAIVQENKWLNNSYERFVNVNGQKVRVSSINPRFLYEKNQNTLLVDTLNYDELYNQITKIKLIDKHKFPTLNYTVNLSKPTEQLGLIPMDFFQPVNDNHINNPYNETNVLLYDESFNKYINDLLYRNTVNFAKDYPSATLFFLIGYPEHQTMTRFMYPNKRLIKKQL